MTIPKLKVSPEWKVGTLVKHTDDNCLGIILKKTESKEARPGVRRGEWVRVLFADGMDDMISIYHLKEVNDFTQEEAFTMQKFLFRNA